MRTDHCQRAISPHTARSTSGKTASLKLRDNQQSQRFAAALLTLVLAAAALMLPTPSHAGNSKELTIAYIGWKKDPRYGKSHLRHRLPLQAGGRPIDGAMLGIKDARFALQQSGVTLKIEKKLLRQLDQLEPTIEAFRDSGVQHFILDLPADWVLLATQATAGQELLLYNVSSHDDALRTSQCAPQLLHTVPSYRMLSDATAQLLTARKWKKLLILQGVKPEDQGWVTAFHAAAKRFGMKVQDSRDFVVDNNPRNRGQNNIALLTGGDYDAVVVLEARGEFAALVPFNTLLPRPVLGSAGLTPSWWHWSWERHGAPQLQGRFRKLSGRDMTGQDWSTWVVVKALVQAIQRSETGDFNTLRSFLLDPSLEVDGFKGTRMNFRPWNGQLRQNILLSDGNWVIDRAPLQGFLHPTDNLDTLGASEREVDCQ